MRLAHSRLYYLVLYILLPALLLGAALQFLVRERWKDSAFQELETNAQALSDLASAYYASGSMNNILFSVNLDLSAKITGADVVVFDEDGIIILCSCSPTGCKHRGVTLNKEYYSWVISSGGVRDMAEVKNLYTQRRYLAAEPVYSRQSGEAVGIVMVSTPVNGVDGRLYFVSNAFVLTTLVILAAAMLAMNHYARRHGNPLQQMAKTATAFGHGDLDARVTLSGRYPKEVEELALSINNMAMSLQKSEYSRQEFVANVSHELKTPMTTISGYVDGVLDGTIPPEQERKYLQIVSDETKRLSRLVRSMLDISQLQSEGGIPDEKLGRFDTEECVGQVLIAFEPKITRKNIQVEVSMPEYPVYTIANQDYISQVVYNLVDNAVKFCPEGGRLGITVREGEKKQYISVSNNGPTIPEEELSLLFDRFHKIDKSRTRNSDGWGLGLYIVKTIVGLHGEDISVTSADGRTEFTFTLPLYN